MKTYTSWLICIVFMSSCTVKSEHEALPPLEYTFLADQQIINPQLKGYWQSLGSGYILDASGDSIYLYSYTENFCYKEKNDYLEGLLNTQSQFLFRGDTLSIYLTDFGDKTSTLQVRNDFVRIRALPDCISFSALQQVSPRFLFDHVMEEIINAFKDKAAIIVDVSFNFGGYDASGLTIAGYFTNQPVLAYTSQVYHRGTFHNESKLYVNPAKVNFTKPVYLLTTDISRSAAESFAMAMQALPNVKLTGTHTLGILSGMLGKSIGEFYFTSSNQRLLSPTHEIYEVSGVAPDVALKVFTKENVFGGHKEAVRKVMEIIEKR